MSGLWGNDFFYILLALACVGCSTEPTKAEWAKAQCDCDTLQPFKDTIYFYFKILRKMTLGKGAS